MKYVNYKNTETQEDLLNNLFECSHFCLKSVLIYLEKSWHLIFENTLIIVFDSEIQSS